MVARFASGPVFALACCALLGLSACMGERDIESQTTRQAMVGGEVSPPGGDDDSVLLLRMTEQGESVCTATLLAKNLAITARHCVAYKTAPLFECTKEGELIENPFGGGYLGADYPGQEIELHGAATPRGEPIARVSKIVSTLSEVICKNDIAFLILDRDLDLPLRALRTSRPTAIGELVDLVGYGATATGQKLDWKSQERRRVSARPIVDVGPNLASDGVDRAAPRTVLLEGPASCLGDSGGPAFSVDTGAVVGVFSLLATTDCSAEKVGLIYTHTSPFEALASQAFELAGAEPLLEPELPVEPDAGPAEDAGPVEQPPPAAAEDGCSIGAERPRASNWMGFLLACLFAARRRTRRCEQ